MDITSTKAGGGEETAYVTTAHHEPLSVVMLELDPNRHKQPSLKPSETPPISSIFAPYTDTLRKSMLCKLRMDIYSACTG